jgi:hypothetical protein
MPPGALSWKLSPSAPAPPCSSLTSIAMPRPWPAGSQSRPISAAPLVAAASSKLSNLKPYSLGVPDDEFTGVLWHEAFAKHVETGGALLITKAFAATMRQIQNGPACVHDVDLCRGQKASRGFPGPTCRLGCAISTVSGFVPP